MRIYAHTGNPTLALCPIQHGPGGRQQPEPSADKHETRDVEWTEMRIGAPTEPHLQQMPRVMPEPVHLRTVGAAPAAQDVTSQRAAIHFRDQPHDEGAEHTQPPPLHPHKPLEKPPG